MAGTKRVLILGSTGQRVGLSIEITMVIRVRPGEKCGSNAFRYDCSHSSFFRAILLSALLSVYFVGYFSFFANKMMQILFGCLSCYSAVSIKALMGNRVIDHNQGNHSLDFILY